MNLDVTRMGFYSPIHEKIYAEYSGDSAGGCSDCFDTDSLWACLMNLEKYRDCLRLNMRVACLALRGHWIGSDEVRASYDRVALHYDENWLCRLRGVTDHLLDQLPVLPSGVILDLGCGTGYTSIRLAEQSPGATVMAQDISEAMLREARNKTTPANLNYSCGDMLSFLRGFPDRSVHMIISAWAIGYSEPALIFRESARVLGEGGMLGFVVNLRDSLQPLYMAFRRTMQRFPGELKALALPRFPESWKQVAAQVQSCGFRILQHEEGYHPITRDGEQAVLSWLLQTGALAGFDAMLPLETNPAVIEYFERQFADQVLQHHYIMGILQRC